MDMNLQPYFVNVIFANITTELALDWDFFSKLEIYPKTYHIGESWSMGGKFIILAPRSVVRAMSMNDLIMSALVPLGSGSL
jgi:hypothetical protein